MAPDDPLLGKTFGPYRLVRRIARGGQSSIYEAISGADHVALKVLHAVREHSPESIERLRREALAIQRLEHPNVVRLLDYGETPDGSPWLAMEYLEGESLAEFLEQRGTLSEAEIVSILGPICEALEVAHRKGIVHRDLKPQNVLLVEQGGVRVPKLVDFGIATLRGADTLTSSVTVSGTPMYMAPEQWEGLKYADERSDVYALGMIVYQALSGTFAFVADTPLSWMKKIQLNAPRELSEAMKGAPVSPAVSTAVMKALAKDPRERPQTPMEFLRALRPPPSNSRPDIRIPRSVRLGFIVLLALLLGGVLGFSVNRRASSAPANKGGPPTVVLMDTPVARGVYDPEAVPRGGTNADTLNDLLRDLPIRLEKETLPSTWNRESHVLELEPALIVIHRSGFFHGLNVEFGFGHEPFADATTQARWTLLYRTADDKLCAFLGLVATANPRTKFLVYSRGTGSVGGAGWPDPEYRKHWVRELEQRFPSLKGRVSTIFIEGGTVTGSFKNPAVVRQIRGAVIGTLGLKEQ